jgi:fused signal recognition particle receptor
MTGRIASWRDGLSKTSRVAFGRLASLLGASQIDGQLWDELEALLIQADLGPRITSEIIHDLQGAVRAKGLTRADQLQAALKMNLRGRLQEPPPIDASAKPFVILVVGVNGSGKTTSIAKLAARFCDEGRSVLLGAADTFRAAATEQLQEWGRRLKLEVVAGAPDSDPGAVAYQAVQAGTARRADTVIIDTAGRLQTRFNLMEELKKVQRVIGKAMPGAPHAVWLVLDATTGQNALSQARAFQEAVGATGVILAKLDSSARGGMAFAIQRELALPILFVGLGEKLEDLRPFDPDEFVNGILAA